ncbi:MAG: DUF2461 domain-containing protein [Psychroflexus sp.]|nr:DUF2461 domain-containing protein [Psychroflexus sp.]MDN6309287.1 DUF2461 domain-containing protein [Psychroflexus sp.]
MDFKEAFQFLEELNLNNNKEWLDVHRDWYQDIRKSLILWCEKMDQELAGIDSNYFSLPGQKALNRINNNLLYHPEKPPYKDHFGIGFDKKPMHCDFYLHLGINELFLASGFYKPSSQILKSVREAIDYNGEEFKDILNAADFKKHFGELDYSHILKTTPRKYEQSHPHIDLLRLKSFFVETPIPKELLFSSALEDFLVEKYKVLLPFRNYLNQAITV